MGNRRAFFLPHVWPLLTRSFVFPLPETVTKDHPARVSAARGRGWSNLVKAFSQPRLGFVLTIYFLFIVAFSIMTTSFSLYTMFRFGYDAQHNGWLFAYVGVIAVVIQGGLIGKLVKRFGELPLVIVGALLFAGSLFAVPFVGPEQGGLIALLVGGGIFSLGNSLSAPALTSLASKSVGPAEQGSVLGVTQSVASLARAVGPALAALLIHSAVAHQGADRVPHYMSDRSLFVTFWTGSAIMFVTFLIAVISPAIMRRNTRHGVAAAPSGLDLQTNVASHARAANLRQGSVDALQRLSRDGNRRVICSARGWLNRRHKKAGYTGGAGRLVAVKHAPEFVTTPSN